MALNWNAETLPEALLRMKYRYDGEEREEMHPALHRFIFLTMTLCGELAGTDKQKADIKKRMAYLAKVEPELVTLSWGEEAAEGEIWSNGEWVSFRDYWKPVARFDLNGKVDGWEVLLDGEWVDRYWGLSTNASRKPFTKWFSDFNKRTLEMMGR